MSLRRALALTLVPLALVGAFAVRGQERASLGPRAFHLDAPIPGEITTLVDAKSRVDYSLPTFPAMVVASPCGALVSVSLTLRQVYATWIEAPLAERQVGLVYSANIWMSVSKKATWQDPISSATELPDLQDVFASDDFPTGLAMGTVRSHTAWVNELGPGFSCTGGDSSQPSNARSGGVGGEDPGLGGGSYMTFDNSLLGQLMWMENGVVVHLVGPYTAAQLTAMASQIQWI
ncbi:MAG TPA: hypothetical protein VGB64_13865 [Actinomycetota bacterium]